MSTPYLESAEAKLISKYWSRKCTERLKELAKVFGKHYYWFIGEEFKFIIGYHQYESFRKDIGDLRVKLSGSSWVHAYYNIPMYYAEGICEKEKILVRQFPAQRCKICGKEGSKSTMLPRYLKYVPQVFCSDLYYCNECLDRAFLEGQKREKTDVELLKDLSDLSEALGGVPAQSMLRNSIMYSKMPGEKLEKVLPVLARISDPEVYEQRFGSWRALRLLSKK